jgi:hypothetical protein
MTDYTVQDGILDDIRVERRRQLAKWGDQRRRDFTGVPGYKREAESMKTLNDILVGNGAEVGWNTILLEEVYEALAELPGSVSLRKELVQAAAVIVAWLEDIDRR